MVSILSCMQAAKLEESCARTLSGIVIIQLEQTNARPDELGIAAV